MKKRKVVKVPEIWMTVYSDFITNEMLFFLVLFGIASISLQKGYTKEQYKDYMEGVSYTVRKEDVINKKAEDMREKISIIEGVSAVKINKKNMRIVLPEPLLFNAGKATLKKIAPKTLMEIGKVLADSPYPIVIEGHTCDIPFSQKIPVGMMRWQLSMARSTGKGPYFSNRELSGARALQILKFFTKNKIIKPQRMGVSAFGSSEPLVSNTNEKNRRLNRRIEIKLIFGSDL